MSSLFDTLNISRQDMLNRLQDLDVVSNNLANVNTAGYKASRSNFQELLEQTTSSRNGARMVNTQISQQQGSFQMTGRDLDWGVAGEGFFQLKLPDGKIAYTRQGQFQLDGKGTLVNADGYPLVWDGTLPPNTAHVSVAPDGTVNALDASGKATLAGHVQLACFNNPSGLAQHGDSVYLVSADSGAAKVGAPGSPTFGALRQNVIEAANVNTAQEMTNMMSLQRAFQMSVRAFQQTDTMIAQAIHMRKG